MTNPPKTKYNPNAWKSPPEVTAAKVPATSAAAAAEVAAAAKAKAWIICLRLLQPKKLYYLRPRSSFSSVVSIKLKNPTILFV